MTDRLYYHDSFLYGFDAEVRAVIESPRPALVLDRTAFYPTSGGQIHDKGWINFSELPTSSAVDPTANSSARFRVTEVADSEDGHVVHYLEAPVKGIRPGDRVQGRIDIARRRDHMQQHSAQHVLSAAFVQLFNMSTVSFHMADDYCSIDLDTFSLTKEQVESAERLANEVVLENRVVDIRFVSRDEASTMGLRKLPPAERDQLRLIDVRDFDLSACGGTHVASTGQIGAILLRKAEKVRQGWRVEFVAGQRAVSIARRDYATLTETAALFSAHIYDVPQQARKSLDEIRSLRKQREQSQEDLAEAQAVAFLSEISEQNGRKLVVKTVADRDLGFLKLLAQKLTRQPFAVIALLASESPQPALVFAQSAGQPYDMGALLKQTAAQLGGRGGGSKDLAQGGIAGVEGLAAALSAAARTLAT
ncbi:MAG: DHHA1 domain-containing protein [Candidatus Sulfotelmatobacter sp.]